MADSFSKDDIQALYDQKKIDPSTYALAMDHFGDGGKTTVPDVSKDDAQDPTTEIPVAKDEPQGPPSPSDQIVADQKASILPDATPRMYVDPNTGHMVNGPLPSVMPQPTDARAPASTPGPQGVPAPAVQLPGDNAKPSQQSEIQAGMADAINKQGQGYDMMQNAAVEGGAAGMKAAAQNAAYMRKTAADLDQMQQDAQTHEALRQQQWDEQSKKVDQALAAKIDPNRMWANASTGQKVATAIGLFLGSFGGANGNAAVKVVDDAINRDIDAQKTDMAKNTNLQTNLLGVMRDKFSDARQAEAASKMFLLDKAQMQVKAMEAQTQNTMAKSNAQMLYGQLEIKKQEARMEALKAYQATGAMADMGGETARVMNTARAVGIKTEDALDDYSKFQHHEDTINQIGKSFDQSARLRTLGNYASSPVQAKRQADAVEAGMIPILGEAYKRFTEAEKETFKNNMPQAGDSAETTSIKRKVITDLMRNKQPEYKTGLISALKIGPKKLPSLGAAT